MSRFVPFRLPENLMLGCATAATQIEGGDTNNSWYEWSTLAGKIKDGSSTLRANQHWERYGTDIDLMANMGIGYYRLGIEWSRIEPTQNHFDEAAVEHYRSEIKQLLAHNIRPLITLHHFSNPLWFEKSGAFETPTSIQIFRRFVIYVVEHLKDLCTDYVTINEPNVYATLSYIYGDWPPGKKSLISALKVMRNLTFCHLNAYRDIHQIYGTLPVNVGFANHLRVFSPLRNQPLDRFGAKLLAYLFQGALTQSMATGKLAFPLGLTAPFGKGRFYDYIGINYYTRSAVRGFKELVMPGHPQNDLGWEIYPEGLTTLCQKQYQKYKAPIWITENGTCMQDDRRRIQFIYDHLRQIADNALTVERFYHWTFMDNFEWLEGEHAPFGLVHCDFNTQERTIRPSGQFYSELIRTRQVSSEMIERYLD
jgi:beta-glucosidase